MTRRIPFVQVDAFSDVPFGGNPAAVMRFDDWPSDDILLKIAAENNLSETAFLVAEPENAAADYALRWFTPTTEIQLCGHATLASGHVVMGDRSRVRFSTRRAGMLEVRREEEGYALDLPAWTPAPADHPEIAALMGGKVEQVLAHERGYLIFRYRDAAAIRALAPDFAALARTGEYLFIATAPGEESDVISRVFAPAHGIDEDPVTGSAHCLLTPYWTAELGRDRFSAIQASARSGRLECRLAGDRAVLTAPCVTVIEGSFLLPDESPA